MDPLVPDAVVLQPWGCGYRRLEEEEGGPGSVPQEPERNPPPDFVLWSLFNTVFLNYFFCLGFLALIFSVKSRDRKMVGDLEGAKHYGATAKHLNIIVAVLLGLCVAAAIFCLVFVYVLH